MQARVSLRAVLLKLERLAGRASASVAATRQGGMPARPPIPGPRPRSRPRVRARARAKAKVTATARATATARPRTRVRARARARPTVAASCWDAPTATGRPEPTAPRRPVCLPAQVSSSKWVGRKVLLTLLTFLTFYSPPSVASASASRWWRRTASRTRTTSWRHGC